MRLNMKVKLVLVAVAISTISIYILSMFMNSRLTILYGEQTISSNQQILNQLSYNLNAYLDEMYRLTLTPYYNQNVMNELKTDPVTLAARLRKRNTIQDFLIGTMVFPRKDIDRVTIISDDNYFSDRVGASLPTYKEQIKFDWYDKVMREGEPLITLSDTNDGYFSIVNVIRDLFDNSKILGVIKVDAKYNTIRQLCENIDMGSSGGVIILTKENQAAYSSFTPKQTQQVLSEMKTENPGKDIYKIYLQSHLYNTVTLNRFGWQVITANSLDDIKNQYQKTIQLTIMVALAVIVTSSVLLYLLMQYLFRPLYSIIKLMKTVKSGDFTVRYQENRRDEVGYLGTTLNTMLDHIDTMFKQNTELDKRVYQTLLFHRETQVQLLYSQIRPHFIYNTLNMISILIQQNQLDQAVDNINKLSMILRGVAYINKEITLETELRLVESYLSIQQSRFGEKLGYSILVDASLYDYVMPALILQPIVENAVIHSNEVTQAKIYIRIFDETIDDLLRICIEDDGDGMSPEKIQELNLLMQQDYPQKDQPVTDLSSMGGLGLANVNARIRMRFGRKYGLQIESNIGKGTTIKVVLPSDGRKGTNSDQNTSR